MRQLINMQLLRYPARSLPLILILSSLVVFPLASPAQIAFVEFLGMKEVAGKLEVSFNASGDQATLIDDEGYASLLALYLVATQDVLHKLPNQVNLRGSIANWKLIQPHFKHALDFAEQREKVEREKAELARLATSSDLLGKTTPTYEGFYNKTLGPLIARHIKYDKLYPFAYQLKSQRLVRDLPLGSKEFSLSLQNYLMSRSTELPPRKGLRVEFKVKSAPNAWSP